MKKCIFCGCQPGFINENGKISIRCPICNQAVTAPAEYGWQKLSLDWDKNNYADTCPSSELVAEKKVYIHYLTPEIEGMYINGGGYKTKGSVGFDLLAVTDVELQKNKYIQIPLGIVVKLPEGYYAEIMPRSSTFKKYGLIMANSVGIVDCDYCGVNDVWHFLVFCLDIRTNNTGSCWTTKIKSGTAIAQFTIRKARKFEIEKFVPEDKSRGGIGSTDKEKK